MSKRVKLISSLYCHIARHTCALPRVAAKPPWCDHEDPRVVGSVPYEGTPAAPGSVGGEAGFTLGGGRRGGIHTGRWAARRDSHWAVGGEVGFTLGGGRRGGIHTGRDAPSVKLAGTAPPHDAPSVQQPAPPPHALSPFHRH